MTTHDLLTLPVAAEPRRTRSAAAAVLRAASRMLDALAARMAPVEPPAMPFEPMLEYHADAAAPEGALYVNGQLVGRVLGVTRL
jgi:hypothetical protein